MSKTKTVTKVASALAFGVLAMVLTATVKPVSVGMVSEARAGVAECKQRCTEKRQNCDHTCNGKPISCNDQCRQAWGDCVKDCEANAK